MSAEQLNSNGKLQHLITLETLPRDILLDLLDTAEALREQALKPIKKLPILRGKTVVNLFFEPSTRTRTSFELAAIRLSADVINFDVANSSTSKGESLLDTLRTIEAMGTDIFVVRHKQNGTPEFLAQHARAGVAIINAGDGNQAHPTQGLLDVFTIRRHKFNFENLSVAIVGDVLHSRVARSDIHALRTLGVRDIRICGPQALLPAEIISLGCRVEPDFKRAIESCDVLIMLRLQKERMQSAMIPSEADYFQQYGLDATRLKLAKPDCIVMHPGPMNRGVEISDEVADGPQSVILEQVANGVAMRSAVMAKLALGNT